MINRDSNIGSSRDGHIDWVAIGIFVALMFIGWLNIYAAVYADTGEGFVWGSRYGSQIIWIGVSLAFAAVIMMIDRIYFHIIAYPFYWFMILMLVFTLFFGTEVNGAKSWLRIGAFGAQPVEFAKMAMALALARYMSNYNFSLNDRRNLMTTAFMLLLPAGIIILQNDTGSAVVYGAFLIVLFREGLNRWVYVALGMVIYLFIFSFLLTPLALLISLIVICIVMEGFMNGKWALKIRYAAGLTMLSLLLFFAVNIVFGMEFEFYWALLVSSVISLAAVAVYAYKYQLRNVVLCCTIFLGSLLFIGTVDYVFDNMLQLHQQKRILNLLGVEQDVRNWGYNVNQSKIAIGSGGFFGKGFLHGTQTKYDFVPEQSTDFIFCTVGEEWGFLGSFVVLALFCFLIIRLMVMGERQHETFGRVYCYSVAAILLFHVLINVGMTIGIMPVIGIPLPLFSYGGSSLLAFTTLFFIAVKLDAKNSDLVSVK